MDFKNIYYFSVLFSCLITFCFAQDVKSKESCSKIDHRTSACLFKPKNQSDTSWCYAYSAAEILSFHFCKEISPGALGLLYSRSKKEKSFWVNGGLQDKAIELGNENGFCLEKELPSQLIIKNETMGLSNAYLELLEENEKFKVSEKNCTYIKSKFKSLLPMTNIADVIKFLIDGQKIEELYKLAFSSCKNPIKEKVVLNKCNGNGLNKLNFITENLLNAPVSMALSPKEENRSWDQDLPDRHAYTLIGRKWNEKNKNCEYLVRDSDGPFTISSITQGSKFKPERWVSQSKLMRVLNQDESMCFSIKK